MVSFDELCRQLAFYNSGDSGNFDVIILTFSLLSYWETSQSLWLSSFARGVVSSTNMKLVQSALEVIFESQAIDGTWVKGGNYESILVWLFFILLVYCSSFFSLVSTLFRNLTSYIHQSLYFIYFVLYFISQSPYSRVVTHPVGVEISATATCFSSTLSPASFRQWRTLIRNYSHRTYPISRSTL
jgi:hypothetical protein